MAQIKNLTPHPIHLVDESGNVLKTFQSEGLVRLKATTVDAGFSVGGCRVTRTEFGQPEGLPALDMSVCMADCRGDYDEGGFGCQHYQSDGNCGMGHNRPRTYFIVSQLVKSALPKRADLLVPAEVVRDTNGNILGCRSLGL